MPRLLVGMYPREISKKCVVWCVFVYILNRICLKNIFSNILVEQYDICCCMFQSMLPMRKHEI